MASIVQSSVVVHLHAAAAEAAVIEAARRALAETGRQIAQRAAAAMTPGHFYDTGLSRENTRWEQLSPNGGRVHIATDYAAYPELGTHTMAPRPVLRPAVDATWPHGVLALWATAQRGLRASGAQVLPPIDAVIPPGAPVSRGGGPGGQGGTP